MLNIIRTRVWVQLRIKLFDSAIIVPSPQKLVSSARGIMKTGRKYLFMISCLTLIKGSKHLRQAFIASSAARQKHHRELDSNPNNVKEEDLSIFVINCIKIKIIRWRDEREPWAKRLIKVWRVALFFKVIAGAAKYISALLIIGRTTHAKLM